MFNPDNDILYEDNHLLIVNKQACQPVQADVSGDLALEDELKAFIKIRDKKPGAVFLGVVHRIDRPVSGIVLFAKTSKALTRLNQMIKERQIAKTYLAITENAPAVQEGKLHHFIERNPKKNKSYAYDNARPNSKEALLEYQTIAQSTNYYLLKINLITGRHHQIRCQLSKIGAPIKGDLKYGAARSNKDGSISLHAYSVEFIHPVSKKPIYLTAPLPKDNLWNFFNDKI